MASATAGRSRPRPKPALKQQAVMRALRDRIVQGGFDPGQRIPTRTEIESEFSVSTITVQRALDALIEQGFVVARGRLGTFVADYPPHLFHYGLVFPHQETSPDPWPRFWTTLAAMGRRLERDSHRKFPVFHSDFGRPDSAEYQKLEQIVTNDRLAGLFFCYRARELADNSILTHEPMPRVALADRHDLAMSISLDGRSFISRAVEHLRDCGRRRIAIVTASTVLVSSSEMDHFQQCVAERGMTTRPQWYHAVDARHPEWAKPLVHLMLCSQPHDRPDGLIIANDNLVDAASGGLIEAGLQVPTDLDVVAHCNFPSLAPSVLPLRRLGYDAKEVLQAAVEMIDQARRNGRTASKPRKIAARLEAELDEVDEA